MHAASVRYDVLRAREAGLSAQRIQQITGVPPRSQRRLAQERIPYALSDQELHQQHRLGRPTVLSEGFRQEILRLLAQNPEVSGAEVLRHLRSECGYREGKNPVYAYPKAHRPAPTALAPLVRFEGVAGEFAQHDFGSLTVAYADGSSEKVTFFAARLKYSRHMLVGLTPGESAEDLLRGLEAAASAWGGLPLLNVVDNTQAAVLSYHQDPTTGKKTPRLNPHLADFLQQVGVFAEPTQPYSGNQEGSVENLVGFVKSAFFAQRRFRHREDVLGQLADWLHYVNEERPSDATGQLPLLRLREEQPFLKALPFGQEGYGLAFPKVVRPDATVLFRGCRYSTPPEWIGQAVTLRLHAGAVVLHGLGGAGAPQTVRHPRVPPNGRYSLLAEHRPALFLKPRGAVMAKRQILMDLCPEGEGFFTQLVHRRPHSWREQDLPLAWALFEQLGAESLVQAFRYCLQEGVIGAEYLQAFAQGVVR